MYVYGMGYTYPAEEEKRKAKEFYSNLCFKVYGNADTNSQGIMSEELIAEHMDMPVEKVKELLRACANYGITERQGGGWVV